MEKRIKTLIKFNRGLNNSADRIYGLVTKQNGSWRGCRKEDDCKKKIVFVDRSIADTIIPNVLYKCSLKPMKTEQGFIAMSATPIKFKAIIETKTRKNYSQVEVRFGNKSYVYSPSDKNGKSIKEIADELRAREDLLNPCQVAEDFLDSVCIVKRVYESKVCSSKQ